MKRQAVLMTSLCLLAASQSVAQNVMRFVATDTTNVDAFLSDHWPYDSSWVALVAYDERVIREYPTIVEVFADSSMRHVLTRTVVYLDSLVASEYYKSGQLKVRNLSGQSPPNWLASESYHPNGQLKSRMRLDSDSLQLVISYYADGSTENQMWWHAGSLFNEYTEWYENGQVKLEAHYERWPLKEARYSYPIGIWVYYKPNGEIEKTEDHGGGPVNDTQNR